MPVAYQTSAAQTFTSAGAAAPRTFSVNPPTGLALGDLWLVGIHADEDSLATFDIPSGWTAVSAATAGQEGWPGVRYFWKTAGSSEVATDFIISAIMTYDVWVTSSRWSGQAGSAIGDVQVSAPTGTSDTIAAPTVSVAQADSIVIMVLAIEGGSTDTITAPTGTSILSRNSLFPSANMAYIARNAGSFSPGNWTVSRSNADNQDAVALTFVILPPGASSDFPPIPRPWTSIPTLLTM